jgi:hypothetical protein
MPFETQCDGPTPLLLRPKPCAISSLWVQFHVPWQISPILSLSFHEAAANNGDFKHELRLVIQK